MFVKDIYYDKSSTNIKIRRHFLSVPTLGRHALILNFPGSTYLRFCPISISGIGTHSLMIEQRAW